MYILVIEHLEEIKLEKSYEVSDEFAETYNLAIKNMDTQINFINELVQQDKTMDKYLSFLALLNESKICKNTRNLKD